MPDQYAGALHELVKAKLEQRAPEIAVEAKGEAPKVINIMAALKESIQSRGRAKVKETVRKRSGKPPKEEGRPASAHARPGARRSVH
jgi:non-homologous end joining protein Ku